MLKSKARLATGSAAGAALFVLILALANGLSFRYHTRWDFTEDGIYSLSSASKRMLGAMRDPVVIKIYFDENVPPEYAHTRRYLKDFLDEMASASRVIEADWQDVKSPDVQQEAVRLGIPKIQFQVMREDKFEIQDGIMGLAMFHGDRSEVIPILNQIDNLEYELMSRVVRLTRDKKPALVWAAGHGELNPAEAPSIKRYLDENFDVHYIDFGDSQAAWPDDTSFGILVCGPTQTWSDTALVELDARVTAGHPAALLLDRYDVDMGSFYVGPVSSGLEKLAAHWGAPLRDGLILDEQNVPVQIQRQQGFFTISSAVNYPYIPRIMDMSRDHPLTRSLRDIAMAFSSPIAVSDTSPGVTVLARTSAKSYRLQRPITVSPFERIKLDTEEEGPYVVAAAVEGERTGLFDPSRRGKIRVMVVSTSEFMNESFGGGPNNLAFSSNIVDWLAASSDLISIRTKSSTFRPMQKLTDAWRNAVKYVNMMAMPLVIALAGVIRWTVRRRNQRS